jgi:hypothetical protein
MPWRIVIWDWGASFQQQGRLRHLQMLNLAEINRPHHSDASLAIGVRQLAIFSDP